MFPIRYWLLTLSVPIAFAVHAAEDPIALARASLQNGLYANAEKHLITYLAANQKTPELCVAPMKMLCQAIDAQQRPSDLLHLLHENADIVSEAPESFAVWEVRSLLSLHRYEEALARCDGALADLAQGNGGGVDDIPLLKALRASALAELPDRKDEALAAFSSAGDALGAHPALRVDLLLRQAQFELAIAKTNEAVQALESFLSLQIPETNSATAYALASGKLLLARIYLARNSGTSAHLLLQALDAASTPPPVRAEALLDLASLAAERVGPTNRTTALEHVRAHGDAIFRLPLSPEQMHHLGIRYGLLLLTLENGLQPAVSALKRAIHLAPAADDSARAQLALADAWLREGSNSVAISEYRNFLEAYSTDPSLTAAALRGQATASLREGNFEGAATLFQKAAQTAPSGPAPDLLSAAQALSDGHLYNAAATILLRAADALAATNAPSGPDMHSAARARFRAADAKERSGDAAAAEELYRSLVGTPFPVAGHALYRLALLAERRGDIATARKRYTRLIDTTTNATLRAQALLGRGRGHYRNFSFQSAIADFSEASRIPSASDEADYLNILAYYGYGLNDEALRIATNLIAHATSSRIPDAVVWVGQYYYNNKEYALAQKYFSDYASRWPSAPSAAISLLWAAYSAYLQAEYQQCIDLLAQLATSYPDNPHGAESRLLQARALVALARFEDATAVLDDLLTRFPGSDFTPSALLLRGDAIYSTPGATPETARQSYLAAAAHAGSTIAQKLECAYKVARCMLRLGEKDEEVIRQYQDRVIAPCMELIASGDGLDPRSAEWYSKSILEAAEIEAKHQRLDAAIVLLERLANSRFPDAQRARDRIENLRDERWRNVKPVAP